MKHCVIFILIAFILLSCQDRKRQEISQLVQEWQGKTILFPDSMFFTIYGQDTVPAPSMDVDYKILTYVDSSGCSGCKMNLFGWKLFLQELEKIRPLRTSVFFDICPNNVEHLKYLLHKELFNYPICLDLDDAMNQANQFPNDFHYQTFLLDCNNRIIAIGNPIKNKKVYSLYRDIIEKHGNFDASDEHSSEIKIMPQNINLGTVKQNVSQECYFTIFNALADTVKVDTIYTSCDCIAIEDVESDIIVPQQGSRIYLSLWMNEIGEFSREVLLRMDNKQEFIITINGTIE